MILSERIKVLIQLGELLNVNNFESNPIIVQASIENNWFSKKWIQLALTNIADRYLRSESLLPWIDHYKIKEQSPMNVGIIMAGNLPLVGFQDTLAVFVSGHKSIIKLSQKDKILWPWILELLKNINPDSEFYFEIAERFTNIDAVIATGSDNSARYFHYYFDKYPHIIRKNRVGLAVLNGLESDQSLLALGHDVFTYYGLGCRNVSNILVPENYDFTRLLRLWDQFTDLRDNHSYQNNLDYNRTLYLLNQTPHLANQVIILTESSQLVSRIATVHYQFYTTHEQILKILKTHSESIQVVVTEMRLENIKTFKPGEAQCPGLRDYADNIDILQFLTALHD